jgi:hypothetical protein
MSQSSPEGIILGKGSKLISWGLKFSDKELQSLVEEEEGYVKSWRSSLTQEQINSI